MSSAGFTINEYASDGRTLGQGSFAIVYLGHKIGDPQHKVAIKVMDVGKLLTNTKDEKAFMRLASEIRIQKTMDHVNIVCLEGVYKDENNVYLVMELCWGDLTKLLKESAPNGLSEARSKRFLQHLASGLKCLRDHNVMHRDLKPQNLLMTSADLDKAVLKITDFGFARALEQSQVADTLCGSPLYMAPEILRGESYSAKADLWSVGSIFFELLTGHPPYPCSSIIELIKKHQSEGNKPVPIPDDLRARVSPECVLLLQRLLEKNPDKRISWAEFFRDSWLQLKKWTRSAEASVTSSSVIDVNSLPSGPQAGSSSDQKPGSSTLLLDQKIKLLEAQLEQERSEKEKINRLLAQEQRRAEELSLKLSSSTQHALSPNTSDDSRLLDALRDIDQIVSTVDGVAMHLPANTTDQYSPTSTVQTVKQLLASLQQYKSTAQQYQESVEQLKKQYEALKHQGESKITLAALDLGDLAMFYPDANGNYTAYSASDRPHFLSEASLQIFAQEKNSNGVIIGRVVMLNEKKASSNNAYGVQEGKDFVEVTLARESSLGSAGI
eukprot:CAMPEP_0201545060 /NCGR_PEP_ID=MMETSP0173_2-20130828/1623_1 /ASSEMBLY_ACC=CAM_ASM_000268 /TAXON_ID=218659 /ORGANISM="Vexillifera sp., Strain DIVA3 564/2" /LENGTH=552 /DNA_ID=CAMNT_0047953367 /DNA_START=6 /DNA_END=1664 /DNA_ORIENTATION=-